MKRQIVFIITFMLMLAAAFSGNAQQSAEQLFQSGLYKEEVKGDLRGAVQIYENILKDFPDNRSVVAKALLQTGLCYEKLGVSGAQKAYRRPKARSFTLSQMTTMTDFFRSESQRTLNRDLCWT